MMHLHKESRFPSFASGENRLRSTACKKRTTPLVPLASLDLPNRGRRVAFGSHEAAPQRREPGNRGDRDAADAHPHSEGVWLPACVCS
jgi:hypothetical protein